MPAFDFGPKVENEVERIEKSDKLTESDRELLFEYKRDMEADGLSDGRVYKVLSTTKLVAERLDGKSLVDATEDDIKDIMAWVEKRDISEWTKTDYRRMVKRFYKWENGGEYPDKVEWVNTTYRGNNEKLPEKLLTEDDIEELVGATSQPRNRALISVMWETGARPGEYLNLEVGSVEDRGTGKKVVLEGKTGARRLPLLSSVPDLNTWLSQHPAGGDPNAPLWCRLDNHPYERIDYDYFRKLIREIAEEAGVNKPMNPYQFRHSRATYLANRLTEAQMCEWFGWVQGSDRPSTYVHLSGRDIDTAYDTMHGFASEEENRSKLSPDECPRCGEVNRKGAKYCQRCGLPMDSDAAQRLQEDEEIAEELYTEEAEAEGNIKKLVDKMVERRLEEILGKDCRP